LLDRKLSGLILSSLNSSRRAEAFGNSLSSPAPLQQVSSCLEQRGNKPRVFEEGGKALLSFGEVLLSLQWGSL
jgi:hypothetical protein